MFEKLCEWFHPTPAGLLLDALNAFESRLKALEAAVVAPATTMAQTLDVAPAGTAPVTGGTSTVVAGTGSATPEVTAADPAPAV